MMCDCGNFIGPGMTCPTCTMHDRRPGQPTERTVIDELVVRRAAALARELGIVCFELGPMRLTFGPEPAKPGDEGRAPDPERLARERAESHRRAVFSSSHYMPPPRPETP